MSILLFVVGAVAFAAGAAMIGYGIPINEFSFGNTLIISGTTAVVGGLIVIGLGSAVRCLQRIAVALAAAQVATRVSRPTDTFEPVAGNDRPSAPAARVPFPTNVPYPTKRSTTAAKAEAVPPARPIAEPRAEPAPPRPEPQAPRQPDYLAPTLANPDEAAVEIEDQVSLSPQHPVTSPAQAIAPDAPIGRRPPPFFRRNEPEPDVADDEPPSFEGRQPLSPAAPPRKAPTTYFDAMWPVRAKPAEPEQPKSVEPEPPEENPMEADTVEAGRDEADRDDAKTQHGAPAPEAASQDSSEPALAQEADDAVEPREEAPQAVAILKSGVVDGMGYTLYVDGSIEAELPQGTLRFASINELRSHLERTS